MSNDYDFMIKLPSPSAKWIAIEVSENDTISDLRTKIFEKSNVSVNTFTIDGKEVSDDRDKIFKTRFAKDVKYSEMATFIKINFIIKNI